MAGIWSDRLVFLQQYKSYAQMSREYGVPYKTMLGIKSTGTMNVNFRNNFDRLWRNESYNAMRSEYVPVAEARARRGGSVVKVSEVISTLQSLLTKWARGASILKFREAFKEPLAGEQRKFFDTVYEQIARSLESNLTEAEKLYADTEQTRY